MGGSEEPVDTLCTKAVWCAQASAVSQLRGERAAAEARAVALEVQLGSARTAAEGVGAAAAQLEEKASPHQT